ncbi:MAG: tetratricopeptide repeat protein [SAR324 cluster bacterium]|nr:tetratricopeptide repeat protein [SAR324 cluster bacterium]
MHPYFLKILQFAIIVWFVISCTRYSEQIRGPIIIGNNLAEEIQIQNTLLKQDTKNVAAHYRLALAYLKMEQYGKAEQHVKQATQLSPLNGSYFELLGDIALRTQRYGIAINAYKSTIRLQPELISAYVKLAMVYEKIQDNERAIAALEELTNRDRQYMIGFYHLARLNLKQQGYEAATAAINQALLLEPGNQEVLILQIRIHSAQGNYYHAKVLTQQFLDKHPNSYAALHEQLKIYFAEQQWEQGIRHVEKLAQKGILLLEDSLIHAHILIRQKKLNAAQTLLEQLLQAHPLRFEIMNELALIFIQKGDLESALTWLQRSLEINDRLPHAHFLKASILFKQGNFLQGDLALNRSITIAPLNRDYQLLYLRRQLMQGEYSAVERQLKELLKKEPLEPKILRLQLDIYTLLGQYKKAENLIHQLQFIHDSDILQFSLARVRYLKREYPAVLPITQQLIHKFPNDWESTYLHISALYQLKRFEEAFRILLPALQQKKGGGFIHRLAGDFHRYRGNEEAALEIYEEGLEMFPRQIYLVDALSSSYLLKQNWAMARNIILEVIDQEHPLKTVLLDRLIYILYQLHDPQQSIIRLQQYNQHHDPILNAKNMGLEQRLLFPVASPVLGYSELVDQLSE